MINQLIANCCKTALKSLKERGVITKLEGLVKVLETTALNDEGKVERFPIGIEQDTDDCCDEDGFPELTPDDQERLIVYFEDQGSTKGPKWTSRLRLIAWGNTEGFKGADSSIISAVLINKFTEELESRTQSRYDQPISNLKCVVKGTPPADTNLFSKYTYRETRNQFLLPPFFAFGLDLELTFTFNSSRCDVNDLVTIDSD